MEHGHKVATNNPKRVSTTHNEYDMTIAKPF